MILIEGAIPETDENEGGFGLIAGVEITIFSLPHLYFDRRSAKYSSLSSSKYETN